MRRDKELPRLSVFCRCLLRLACIVFRPTLCCNGLDVAHVLENLLLQALVFAEQFALHLALLTGAVGDVQHILLTHVEHAAYFGGGSAFLGVLSCLFREFFEGVANLQPVHPLIFKFRSAD